MRASVRVSIWVGMTCAFAHAVGAQDLAPQKLPVYGGSGGTAFSRDCGAGKVLTGLRYRAGLYVDALGLLCRPVLSDGALGPESTVGTLVGGGGGKSGIAHCAAGMVVTGAFLRYGTWVDMIQLMCRTWIATTRRFNTKDFSYAVPFGSPFMGPTPLNTKCESSAQPGSGIRGRASTYVDAVGFVCDEP